MPEPESPNTKFPGYRISSRRKSPANATKSYQNDHTPTPCSPCSRSMPIRRSLSSSTTSTNSSRDAETEKAGSDDEGDAEDEDDARFAGGPVLFALDEVFHSLVGLVLGDGWHFELGEIG
ncbi:uncharacterized protein PAC_10498 [Phialocephala subalpina]|uniref:Uncharacterized protein n=1 Tax=Phialocephala subalpina TaxID=576137 RepID=A0A1L7X6H3_9HELO|nr:uncharacterized protein PAC_10498 [Phialocephala subalpina]